MRKSFDGLAFEVKRQMSRDATDGHLYAFLGNNPRRMKLLLFDRHGFWIFYRRLERGTFELPKATGSSGGLEVDTATLAAILDGVDLCSMRRRMRYKRPPAPS